MKWLFALLMVFASTLASAEEFKTVHLEHLNLSMVDQEWGEAHYQQSISWKDLTINGRRYERGIGTHARSEFSIDLKGVCTEFHAVAGLDDGANESGSVEFRILLDDKEVFSSGVMKRGMEGKEITLDLKGAKRLTLLVDDANDGISNDHADWADAYIRFSSGSKQRPEAILPYHNFVRTMKKYTISGQIGLPGNRIATEDVKTWVHLWDENRKSFLRKPFLIRKGTGSVPFRLTFAKGTDWSKRFSIGYEGGKGYIAKGFHASDGMVEKPEDATLLQMSGHAMENLDLKLISGYVVRGRIALPEGTASQNGVIKCWVNLTDAAFKTFTWPSFIIPEGADHVDYEFVVSKKTPQDKIFSFLDVDRKEYHSHYFHANSSYEFDKRNALAVQLSEEPLVINYTLKAVESLEMTKPANSVWLEELNLSFMSAGWHKPLAGRSIDNHVLTLQGRTYKHGVGTHAQSEMVIDVKGTGTRFRSAVGVDDETNGQGSVRFLVYGDDQLLFDSGIMRHNSIPKQVEVDLHGVRLLKLVADQADNSINSDHADWAGAYLEFAPDATELPEAYDAGSKRENVWLETLDFSRIKQGWGFPQKGRNVNQNPITLNGITFMHGLGTHAVSQFVIHLNKKADRFKSFVGVDDGAGGGSTSFLVYGDNDLLFDSGVVRKGDTAQAIDLDVSDMDTLILYVGDGGDGTSNDWACWANARLVMKEGFHVGNLSTTRIPQKWLAEYFNSTNPEGVPAYRSEEIGLLDLDWGRNSPSPNVHTGEFSALFTKEIQIRDEGLYIFNIQVNGSVRVYIDGKLVHDRWTDQKGDMNSFPWLLSRGSHAMKLEYYKSQANGRIAFSYAKNGLQNGRSISGTLTLPKGAPVESNEAGFFISAKDMGSNRTYWASCNIKPSQSQCDYDITVPNDDKKRNFLISYLDQSDRFLGYGYYAGAETVWERSKLKKVEVSGKDIRGINLTVLEGVRISGRVLLKEGDVALRDEKITVRSFTMDGTYHTSTSVILPRGASSAPYTLIVPGSKNKVSHYVIYKCDIPGYTKEIHEDLIRWSRMTVENVVTEEVKEKVSDVRLYKKAVISGTVSLPPGYYAPADGMRVEVKALTQEHFEVFGTTVLIPEGTASADYSLEVPSYDAEHEKYVVRYVYWGAGFVRAAYWNGAQMIPFGSFPLTWHLDVSQGDRPNINLTLLPDNAVQSREDEEEYAMDVAKDYIKENIKPEMTEFEKLLIIFDYMTATNVYYSDKAAAERKLKVMEGVWSYYAVFVNHVTVCGGYSMGLNYLLKLARVESLGFGNNVHAWNKIKIGGRYFFADATTAGNNYHTFLVSDDQYRWADNKETEPKCNKIFKFKEEYYPHKKLLANSDYRRIIGTIRLPGSDKAPKGGMSVRVNGVGFFIPEGETQITYLLKVNINEAFRKGLAVTYDTSGGGYVNKGYYSEKGTCATKFDASPLFPGEQDITGIDMTLIRLPQRTAGKARLVPADLIVTGVFASGEAEKSVSFKKTTARYVCLESLSSLQNDTYASMAGFYLMDGDGKKIDRSKWRIFHVDSEETTKENGLAENVLDDHKETIWHTEWGTVKPPHPHYLAIDLGEEHEISGFVYQPRTENANGRIKEYRFYSRQQPFEIQP